jgi:UPF0755 protein
MGYIRERLQTRRGRHIAVVTVLILLILWVVTRYTHQSDEPKLIYIPEGTPKVQYHALKTQQLILDPADLTTPLPPGWVRLKMQSDLPQHGALITALWAAPREKTRRVVMYSGDTIHLFTQKLADQTRLDKDHLLNAYYRFSPYSDGGILAGYYQVPFRTAPDVTLYALVARSEAIFRTIAAAHHIPYDPKTFKHYLTVASIIQKETWHTDEMPRIASVIYNRLKKGMKLQLDATLNYGPYAHTPVTPERIRTDASHFNTYRYSGLPPEPIGSVSRAALEAAMAPARTDYLYFVRNPKGWHDFSRTYSEHLKKIQRYKEQKEANVTENSHF